MKHYATATWKGNGKNGRGEITTESMLLESAEYSFNSRFANDNGTNPEELLAAAHASCFTMKLSFVLGEAGFEPAMLETICHISFENGFMTGSQLFVKAKVPGISQELFDACIKETEACNPMSTALNLKTTVKTTLRT